MYFSRRDEHEKIAHAPSKQYEQTEFSFYIPSHRRTLKA